MLVEASWSALSEPFSASPSIVVISCPSAWTPSTVHDFTDSPSSSTVQAPHDDVSQPTTCPGQAEPLAQDVDEQLARLELELVRDAVDREGDVPHSGASFRTVAARRAALGASI